MASSSRADADVAGRVSDLPRKNFAAALAEGRLGLRTGPFWSRIRTRESAVVDGLARMYGAHPFRLDPAFCDFHLSVVRVAGPRRWLQPQVTFLLDGVEPFKPLPAAHAFPLFEWGLNWCIASLGHRWLLAHAAVLARGDRVLVLPAESGSGKSTLCAALAGSAWRLFSDEVLLMEPESGLVLPLARPINLKNDSIRVIHSAFPDAEMTAPIFDTKKGTVAHLAPSRHSVDGMDGPGRIRWVVFPKWKAGASTALEPLDAADVFAALVNNAFNYDVQGEAGFLAMARIARECRGFRFEYSRLDEAIEALGGLP